MVRPDVIRPADPSAGMSEKARLLGRTTLFGRMRPEDLAALATRMKERPMRRGEVLLRRGEPGTTMLIIVTGQICIVLPSSDGREQVLRIMQPGEVLGELALLDGGSRTADAVAETNGRLLVVERDDLTAVLRSDPDLALALMSIISERLRTATWLLESMLFNDTAGRLASTLLILSHGKPGERLDITQGALGERVGAARETINRKLREWQAAGVIAMEPGRITVLDAIALRQFAPSADATANSPPRIW
jgi:CRP/FNR family cyclic AMP-dependent transcriptional regulator